jgi:3-mercaptopyruvate sulfurtransferase SseA
VDRWTPQVRVVVYCDGQGCDASRDVARRLQKELSLHKVFVLKGGWDAWAKRHQ